MNRRTDGVAYIPCVERLSTGPNPCAYDACFSNLHSIVTRSCVLTWDQALMAPSSVTWRISFLARLNHDAEDRESGGDIMAASAEDTRPRNNLLLLRSFSHDFSSASPTQAAAFADKWRSRIWLTSSISHK